MFVYIMKENRDLSVAEAVRKIVLKHFSLLDCITMDAANYSKVSKIIYDEVVDELGGRNPSLYAMKMALKRYSLDMKRKRMLNEKKIAYVLENSQLEMINDVVLYTFKLNFLLSEFTMLLRYVKGSSFIHVTQGKQAITIVMDRITYNQLRKYIREEYLIEVIDGQSAVILVSPHDIINTPGVVNYITTLLYFEGINITQIISSYVDTIIIVNKLDGIRAYSLLENIIGRFRG